MPECIDCLAEATHGVCCAEHAPLYEVQSAHGPLYETRSLRRAWEAERYYHQQGYYFEASIIVPDRVDVDSDGLSDEEDELLDEWTVFGADGKLARFHFCLAPEDSEMRERARRAFRVVSLRRLSAPAAQPARAA